MLADAHFQHIENFPAASRRQGLETLDDFENRFLFRSGAGRSLTALVMGEPFVGGQVPFVEERMTNVASNHATPPIRGYKLNLEVRRASVQHQTAAAYESEKPCDETQNPGRAL